MSSDMKRLVEATEAAVDQAFIDASWGRDVDVEAIVRAVLTELREVSVPMYKAGGTATVHGGPYGEYNIEVGEDAALASFIDIIDFVLAEPATA